MIILSNPAGDPPAILVVGPADRLKDPRPRGAFPMKQKVWRAVVEMGFIIFLFYSNLLMGEFEGSGLGQKVGFVGALRDVFTISNFLIAAIAAFIGYAVFEFLRSKF
jgi:hypothetical protein